MERFAEGGVRAWKYIREGLAAAAGSLVGLWVYNHPIVRPYAVVISAAWIAVLVTLCAVAIARRVRAR